MMYDLRTTASLAFGFLAVLYIGRRALGKKASLPLPPGPPGIPWVGNVTGVNPNAPWETYAEWAKIYGDLIYTRMLGQHILVINSEKVAKDLLENRSTNYSDRPYVILIEKCGTDFSSTFLPYGDRWRLHRRFFHSTFRPEAAPRFVPYLQRRACYLLRQMFDSPDKFEEHIQEYATATIMNSTYEYEPSSRNDEFVNLAVNTINIMLPIMRPDRNAILGAFPWLLYLPAWFPGMSFKNDIKRAYAYSKQYLERPFEYSLSKAPSAAPSLVHDALRQVEEKGVTPDASWMEQLKGACGTAFLAATDGTSSVLRTFILMMVVNPAVQEKAQAQIDAVVGQDRLPTMDDRDSLPFVDAIYWETLRYNVITPLSFPHVSSEDDVYNGFHIPKGATFLTNAWSMSRDETKFPSPNEFIPERFLSEDGSLSPTHTEVEPLAFGFGRRGCPGKHFASLSVWGVISKILAAYKILKPLDENGEEIQVEPKFSTGISVNPLPFKCRIVPRIPGMDAEKLEQLIASSK